VVGVAVRSALCFLGRADAVVAAPRTRTAKARVTILDNGTLHSKWHHYWHRSGERFFFIVHGKTIIDPYSAAPHAYCFT